MKMKIFLIRHALTAQSKNRFISEDAEDLCISEEGKKQALILRNALKTKAKPDMIFTSLSKRSVQTAMLVFPYSRKKIIKIKEFNEIDKGLNLFLMNNPLRRKMT